MESRRFIPRLNKAIRVLHKWTAIAVGLFFLAWLISGIVMVIPKSWLGAARDLIANRADEKSMAIEIASRIELTPATLDFKDIQVSIPSAVSILERELGQQVQVAKVTATWLDDGLVYQIALQNEGLYLVDALTGTPVLISESKAQRIAQRSVPIAGQPTGTTLLDKGDYYYWGSLPAYKTSFSDGQRTIVYVSAISGQIEQTTTRLGRLRQIVTGIHTFQPLRLVFDKDRFRKGALILTSLTGIAVAVTGFYLAWPIKRRPLRRENRREGSP